MKNVSAWLQHRLTDNERNQFEKDGYLTVENALSSKQIASLTSKTDAIFDKKLKDGHDPAKPLFHPNFLPDDPEFVDLIDHPLTFPKVWDILGWNIFLYHAHLIVTPPTGQEKNDKTFGWHQDSARVNRDIETSPRPRLSLKIAYFLSDVSEEGRGNFWIIPGSHLQDEIERPVDGVGQPDGAVPVCVKPGTAVFFDRRLWHTASPNWSDVTRKVLFYGYSYRWLKTKDDMTVEHLWEDSEPIRRQLLGHSLNCNGTYRPQDEEVPLRVWLKEHCPEKAGD